MNLIPGQGSARVLGGLQYLPKKYEAGLMSGIRFFEVMYPAKRGYTEFVMGFYDLKATEIEEGASMRFQEQWLIGHNAGIEFKCINQDREIAIAYIPDDRFYHNRVALAGQYQLGDPKWRISQILSANEGAISGAIANMEIECLCEFLYHEVPIFDVVNRMGNKKDWFKTREEAQRFIDSSETQWTGPGGVVPTQIYPYKGLEIVPGKMIQQRPEIAELVVKYKYLPNGWTTCDAFLKGILPKVNARIAQRKREMRTDAEMGQRQSPGDVQAIVFDMLANMSSDQFDSIKKAALARKQELAGAVPAQIDAELAQVADAEPIPEGSPEVQPEVPPPDGQPVSPEPGEMAAVPGPKYPKYKLEKMKLADLQKIAVEFMIPYDGMKRLPLIDEIMKQQTAATADIQVS